MSFTCDRHQPRSESQGDVAALAGNTHRLLHAYVICCLWLPSDPGIFSSATLVLLGIGYDPILSNLQLVLVPTMHLRFCLWAKLTSKLCTASLPLQFRWDGAMLPFFMAAMLIRAVIQEWSFWTYT